jgi:hypothetical protein
MKRQKHNKSKYDESRYFVRIFRNTVSEYLDDKKLSVDEFFVLIWIHLRANPFNAVMNTSYDAVRMELSGKYSKNEINKICLSLKSKRYIHFESQQGRRSSFPITVANYPLVSGYFKDISNLAKASGRSLASSQVGIEAEEITEVELVLQKSEKSETAQKYSDNTNEDDVLSRSTNIETDNEIDNENNYADDYTHNNQGNRLCVEISKALGLNDAVPLLEIKANYGIEIVLESYNILSDALCQENRIEDPVGFFFSTVNKLVNNNSP